MRRASRREPGWDEAVMWVEWESVRPECSAVEPAW
jgi:hypothetical protein